MTNPTTAFRFIAAVAPLLLAAACASSQLTRRQECHNPDAQLEELVADLDAKSGEGCWNWESHDPPSECERLRREIERLSIVCPNHVPTLLTNAVMAHEAGQSAKAQQFLDRIFEYPRSHPDAAALRGQIAIEDGNLPFARRFLEQQIRLAPDSAQLRETYAAALYLGRQFDEARRELMAAEGLGSPRWRVAYHLGLLEEAAGRLDEAQKLYAESVEKNPGWAPAQSRLRSLRRP